jgi:nucleoside-diphosphate-sugar epimerase
MITVVTGASGHVGNNLVRALLDEGRQVRVLIHRDEFSLAGLNVEKVRGEVCDIDSLNHAFKGADVVYHLASKVSIESSGWEELQRINCEGSRNVVEACNSNNVRRLIHFSSIDAIEQKPITIPVDESSPAATSKRHPPYDRSKAAGEAVIKQAIEQGLDAVIVNPTAVVGPFDFQPSHQGQMLLMMARGKMPALVEGGFDWVDVRDVVSGALSAEKNAPRGAKYILGGHWASLADIAAMVEDYGGAGAPGFICPLWLAGAAAPLMTAFEHARGKRPLYTRASMIAVNSNKHISHDKAARELGYNPRPLADTIRDTLDWFAKNERLERKQ